MRRTYRSKKETSGALDPKDVLLTMDDKSSAFDAYYIQNIKQTKKEMSSVHLHAGYNKVRKRKYVKRIVKDVEPVHRESALESVYLTPNKSLRVNKPLDPFDQLLNSPSTIRNHCLSDRNGDIFSKIRKERKTYTKRNLAKKIKKYNCSSSDSSESDKENSTNETKETSNILMHQLLIEKDDKTSPKHFDRSISQLVQKLTVLKKFDNQSTSGGFSELNFSRNRLTTSIQSPKLRNSPLCSTPLKEKYRGASIYNFSPINFTNNLNNRRNCMDTTDEKNNNSSLFVKCNINKFENDDLRKEENLPDEFVTIPLPSTSIERHNDKSAVTETSINCIKSPIERYNDKSADIETSDDCIKPASSKRHNDIFAVTETSDNCIKLPIISSETSGNVINNSVNVSPSMCEKESINVTSIVKVTSKEVCEVYKEKNAMQYSKEKSDSRNSNSLCEEDPLDIVSIGNAADEKNHESYEDIIQNSKNELNSQVNNSVSETSLNTMVVVCKQIHENCKDDFVHLTNHSKENFKISSFEVSSLQTTELEPFLGFLIDNQETELNKEVDYKECNSNINVLRDDGITCNGNSTESSLNSELCESKISFSNKSLDKSIMLCTKGSRYVNFVKRDIDNLKPDDSQLSSKVSSNEQSEDCNTSMSSLNDDMSMYDTCDSGQSFQNTSEILFTKEPVVVLEKMNDSAFRRYYEKMDVYETEGTNSSYPDTDHYGSFDENTTGNPTNDTIDNNDNTEENNDLNSFCEISDDDDTEANSNGNCEEDRCISYVTTRRRNEITNDSMIFDFNDSYDSRNSLDCDKTVLSNNKYSINVKCELTDVEDLTLVNNSPVKETINILTEEEYPQCPNPGSSESNVMTGRNSRTLEFSVIENSIEPSRNSTQETKPSIVLQPGKKWERSLSIYRRMTMMTDHFDHSILDDEPMHRKGRKYRQSVISTMEMQDISDSLHNDSIKSRRSTFVSKPCRSSIKIVKQPNCSRLSLSTTTVFDDLKGFLTEVCDDTIIELSKLSIADSEHEVTVLENFHDTAGRVSTPRDYVLRRCNQTDSILFDECYPDTVLKNCRKIGEGVYGEVFLWRAGDGRVRVMKIVPIAGTTKVNGEHQKDFHEIISEIVIAMELSALRAPIAEIESHFDEGKDVDALDLHSIESATDIFNEVLAVRCVYGSYPSRLLDLWELYDETKGSENDSPAILPLDQQYIVLELANAGQDLESYQFNSAEQAHALFLQCRSMTRLCLRMVAYGLAVGEESFQFEHRDLHWGNVLIAPTDQKFATFVFRGRAHRVPRCGVAATIIDYSLSRLSLPLSPHAAAADSAALYNDLSADDGLFDARGDYQFEVYRLMRDKLGNDWKNFEPYTNILWLHYTVDKMITALRYKRTNTKIHKHYIAKLKGIKNRILDYGSAAQFVLTDIEF